MSDENKAQAQELKNAGNAAYKARQFEEARSKYQQAWDLDKDITCWFHALIIWLYRLD